jgi:hypothetical protein
MVTVNKEELYSAYQFVSAASDSMAEAFISLDTGKIFWVSDEIRDLEEEEIPDDLETSNRYLAIPNEHDLDLGQVSSFASSGNRCLNIMTGSPISSAARAPMRASGTSSARKWPWKSGMHTETRPRNRLCKNGAKRMA